jgi:NitT/TauT family transport system ATP-binding protein
MDEPFASLDALTRRQMQEELLELWADTQFTLVFVTHSIDEAMLLGSTIVLLSPHPGRVVERIGIDPRGAEANPRNAEIKAKINAILFKDKLEYVI